ILSEENTTLMLRDLRWSHTDTVDEALSARASVKQITLDLQAVVREAVPIVHLQYVLDGLAQAPAGADAREAAQFVAKTYSTPEAGARDQLPGPHRGGPPPLDDKLPRGPYAETLPWTRLGTKPVRVRVGTELRGSLLRMDGRPLSEVAEGVEK